MSGRERQLPHEWRPDPREIVVDDRPNTRGSRGVVISVEVGGPHFADLDYWVDVHWDGDVTERHVASHWLYRADGTQ